MMSERGYIPDEFEKHNDIIYTTGFLMETCPGWLIKSPSSMIYQELCGQ